jgi:hypothetical protein
LLESAAAKRSHVDELEEIMRKPASNEIDSAQANAAD